MVSSLSLVSGARQKPNGGKVAGRLLGIALVLLVAPRIAGAMTYGRVTYSDMSVGSDGTIYGWGVTDANSGGCYCHTAKVTTTIRSPNGRARTASDLYGSRDHEYARADVQLSFDQNDLGEYMESSVHWAFCPYCNCYYVNGGTTQSTMSISLAYTTFQTVNDDGDGHCKCTPDCQNNITPACGLPYTTVTIPHSPCDPFYYCGFIRWRVGSGPYHCTMGICYTVPTVPGPCTPQ